MTGNAKEKEKIKSPSSTGWKQRKHGEQMPAYGDGTKDCFTVEIHYGGSFGEWGYYDEDVGWFDYVEPERFSLMELNKMVVGLVKKEDYMQYLWLPDGEDINSGLFPIYNDEDVATMVDGRVGGMVLIYIRDLTDDEVDALINSHVEQVQMLVETSQIRSGVRIEEIVAEPHPTQTTVNLCGKRKRTESRESVLLLGWREEPTPANDPPLRDPEVANNPTSTSVGTNNPTCQPPEPEVEDDTNNPISGDCVQPELEEPNGTIHQSPPTVTDDSDSDDDSDDSSIQLVDSDVDVYDDIDVQERFDMDRMWQDSAARDKEPVGDDTSEGRDNGDQSGSQSMGTKVNGASGSAKGAPERNKSSGGSNSGKHSRSFTTGPEPQEVDSDMETDESGFARRLVFDSDDEEEHKGPNFPEFNREKNLHNPEFQVGMIFTDLAEFKEACKAHAVLARRPVHFHPNDRSRCQCLCKQKCDFRIWASWLPRHGYAQIRSANFTHTCGVVQDLRACTKEYLATKYLECFRVDPSWAMSNIIHTVQTDLGLHITHMKAFRTKMHVLGLIHGEDAIQFGLLHNYKLELEKTNPGSTVVLEHNDNVFEKIYICLDAVRRGFLEGCRRIIGVDGCHLRGVEGWQMLSAVSIDANDCMYPIAYAIVEKECTESWEWFLGHLGIDLGIDGSSWWTFMSDRQKGLMNVIRDMYPNAEHRCCVRHMYVNFSGKFGRTKRLKDLLWGAARATYKSDHQAWMDLLEKENANFTDVERTPHAWLLLRNPEQWCKAYYRTETKCEMALNNLCECFNKYILEPRGLPILSCLEAVRVLLMRRLYKKRIEGEKFGSSSLCPKPRQKLNLYKEQAALFTPTYNGEMEYQVRGPRGQFVVDLLTRTCACGRWQLSGIPCPHAIRCIQYRQEDPENYVDNCYSVDVYKSIYERSVRPLNDSTQWSRSGLQPLIPPQFPQPRRGAKQTKRRKEAGELETPRVTRKGVAVVAVSRKGSSMTCSKCKKKGHNKRGCKDNENRYTTCGSPPATGTSQTQRTADALDFMPTPRAALNDSPARNTRSKTARRN